MFVEEYGKENEKIIIMLHGANFVHTFAKQYPLAEKYHLIVPHLMGYGNETDKTFEAQAQVNALAEYIAGLGQRVALVGFSLGAQVACKLLSEHGELFTSAVIISPWLDKNNEMLNTVMAQNEKQFALFKKKWLCSFVGFMNGLTKPQRKVFAEQMQKVTIETVRNSVDNGITLDSLKGFENVNVPIYALAGSKEQAEVMGSVKALAEKNPKCKCEIWQNAAHNIPLMYAKRLNDLIESLMKKN